MNGLASRPQVTPESITELGPLEIFVFGSSLEGRHDGGAAKIAREKFGAIYGKGVGIQGRSYALPTMNGIGELALYVSDFLIYAEEHYYLTFYLTRVGCGIAGLEENEVKRLFKSTPINVVKPEGW